jgi:acyl-CoA reductase-like NAD-dependent aldehyde dehydrogenase
MVLEIRSPYNASVLGTVALDSALQLEEKIATGKKLSLAFPHGLPKPERMAVLEKLSEKMKQNREDLIIRATREGGKPYKDSAVEVDRAIMGVELAKNYIPSIIGEEIPMGLTPSSQNRRAWTMKEPVGLVAAISAFNHPVNLIIHQVVTAFAAGCPVIVKPDLRTPLSCLRIIELLMEAGAPAGWCQVTLCDNDLAEKLATDPRVNFLSFIGSAKIGWHLRSKIAPGTRCALEHGGLAPVIVEPDADFESMIPALTKGSFYHAGQVCVSTQRIFVHHSIAKKLCDELKTAARQLKTGDPLLKDTDIGPIIAVKELERIDSWVQHAIKYGAELICGGTKMGETCYAPTILLNPPKESDISQKEIFGPVVAIYSYTDLDEAINAANETRYHFQAAVFTKDYGMALKISNLLNASTVLINDHTAFRVDWMPFGGRDESGLGVGGIKYSIEDLLQEKLIIIKN